MSSIPAQGIRFGTGLIKGHIGAQGTFAIIPVSFCPLLRGVRALIDGALKDHFGLTLCIILFEIAGLSMPHGGWRRSDGLVPLL